MANERIVTTEDTLAMLREKAAKESDEFSIKVLRSTHNSMTPDRIAMFSGATVNHLVSPELWLPEFAGGGKYKLQAFHISDPNRPVGGVVSFPIEGEPTEVDIAAVTKTSWRGPAVLEFPQKQAGTSRRPQDDMGYGGAGISPPGPGTGDSASRTNLAWPRVPGGGVHREQYDDPYNPLTPRGLAAVEAERRKLEDEKLQAERERAKDRLEAQQKLHAAEMAAFRAEMMAELKSAKAVPTGPDPMVEMLKQQAEDRREAAKQAAEDRRANDLQRAEDRRVEQARQERADERFSKLLEKISDKPKEDPLAMIAKVAEILKSADKGNSNEATMKMMHNMAEMHGMQIDTAMQFIETAANMQLGGPPDKEPGWIKGLQEVVKTVGSIANGVRVNRPPLAPPPPPPPAQIAQGPAQPAQPEPPPPPAIDQIVIAIRGRNIPVAQIAQVIREQIEDESLRTAFFEAGGDFEEMVRRRLGNWGAEKVENAQYLVALIAEVKRQFIQYKIIEADEPAPQAPAPAAQAEQQEEEAEYVEEGAEGDEADDE